MSKAHFDRFLARCQASTKGAGAAVRLTGAARQGAGGLPSLSGGRVEDGPPDGLVGAPRTGRRGRPGAAPGVGAGPLPTVPSPSQAGPGDEGDGDDQNGQRHRRPAQHLGRPLASQWIVLSWFQRQCTAFESAKSRPVELLMVAATETAL
jgi:hypothetical protein